ncbi:MAG TPA: bifunctional precorrin-2 dehydrogenase/sirohydrochlorin ferrochelatase [Acidimicrobiia bacterium]|nr:bifunctional precorrin-2 dehydrogenase/sirohydrochlorin ferrochelatase [Acidimicrobiia bacterium]
MSETPGRPGLAGWPVNLLVRDRPVVVVGAGRIAARKIEPLLELGAVVIVVAPAVGDEIRAWHEEGRLTLHERRFDDADLDGVWLAVTATPDAAVNAAVKAAGDARRVFVNSADDPAHCSFTLLSVVRQADVVVAIGTGGRSPALATWLKRRARTELGPEYATLLDLLSEHREALRATGASSEDADWQRAFESGILDLVRSGRIDEAKELLRTCL